MTETCEILLKHFQIRKTKTQKTAFLHWAAEEGRKAGYTVTIQKSLLGSRNLIFGDPAAAKVVFTAHYDTCTRLFFPNFITPKSRFCYLLWQGVLSLLILMAAVPPVLAWVYLELPFAAWSLSIVLWGMVFLMLFGPANRHTANDNTSGVATVLESMAQMPENLRKDAAFVLFDLEEAGLLGSFFFSRKYKSTLRHTLLLNFDCVSDGDHLLFCLKKRAELWLPALESAFANVSGKRVELCQKGYIYPSDQMHFPCGVGAAALRQGPFGLLYLSRIHTRRDTVFQPENIALLSRGAVRLTGILAKN